jgi:hypothetical protein
VLLCSSSRLVICCLKATGLFRSLSTFSESINSTANS